MYNQDSIDSIIARIGFGVIQESGVESVAIDEEVATGTSGRIASSFHQLITVDNIYFAIPQINASSAVLNKYLKEIREQAAIEVLTLVLDHNDQYDDAFDYSETIINKAKLFDNAVGFSIASKIIELFITTSRANFHERNAKLAYNVLKIELEGAKNERGFKISAGLRDNFSNSVRKATQIIFPRPILVQSEQYW